MLIALKPQLDNEIHDIVGSNQQKVEVKYGNQNYWRPIIHGFYLYLVNNK